MSLPRIHAEESELSVLLAAARGGCKASAGRLLDRYRSYLLLIANRNLGADLYGKGAPSDIVQTTLMDATQSLESFEGARTEDLTRWLRKILRNNLVTFAAQFRNTAKRQLDKEQEAGIGELALPEHRSPSRMMRADEQAKVIRHAIAGLQHSYRRAIALRFCAGASFEEIAQLLNRTPEAARKLTERGTEELRRALLQAGLSSLSLDMRSLVSDQIFEEAHFWCDGDQPTISWLRQFKILRELGGGAFGVVYLAHDTNTQKEVALKIPRPYVLRTIPLRNRFIQETVLLGRLTHPNLMPVYEAGQVGPLCYLASAYCRGPTLGTWLAEMDTPVTRAVAIPFFLQLVDAVRYIHSQGVLHRDIKPTNILLEPGGESIDSENNRRLDHFRPMLTDFGLAKVLEDENHLTPTGFTVGTAAYMAPEQLLQSRSAGPAADIYSLGVVLYEMFSGATPSAASAILQTTDSEHKLFSLAAIRPDVPDSLVSICNRCLQPDPAERYRSANELMADLIEISQS